MLKKCIQLFVVFLLVCITGCMASNQSKVRTNTNDMSVVSYAKEAQSHNQVVFVDRNLNSTVIKKGAFGTTSHKNIKISILESGISTTPVGNMMVWTRFKNHTDHTHHLEARTEFFDENKIPLNDVSNWSRLFIGGNSDATYKANATSSKAAFFRTQVREVK